jgi:SAM-dependent methyltransferase
MAKTIADKSVTLETVDCGICGSKHFQRLFDACDYIYGNRGSWPVAQCKDCGVVFMNPRIPPAKIGPYYPTTYYTNKPNMPVEVPPKKWRRNLKAAALQRYYGYPPTNKLGLSSRLVTFLAGQLVSRTAAYQRNIYYAPHGRVLDVGCGNGACLTKYKELGWETFGTEVGSDSATLARAAGHDIFLGELKDAHYPEACFDAVTLWDALEHIPNPGETMAEVYRVCRPGGRVYVYVPNFGSWYARHYHDNWFMFTAPLHYYHYTVQTLTRLLKYSSFRDIQIRFPLGDAGFLPTISAATVESPIIHSMITTPPCAMLLKLADRFLPRGHLLAVANKAAK